MLTQLACALVLVVLGVIIGICKRRKPTGTDSPRVELSPYRLMALCGIILVVLIGFAVYPPFGCTRLDIHNIIYEYVRICGIVIISAGLIWIYKKPLRSRLIFYWLVALPLTLYILASFKYGYLLTRIYFRSSPHLVSTDGFILQSTGITCGPASLANLMRLYGEPATEAEMGILMEMSYAGSVGTMFCQGAKRKGWECRDLKTDLTGLLANNRPCLVSLAMPGLNMMHSCLVAAITDTEVFLVDPLQGLRRMQIHDFASCWTGAALFIQPPATPPPYDFRKPYKTGKKD